MVTSFSLAAASVQKNGVGVILDLDSELKSEVIDVTRHSDRLMLMMVKIAVHSEVVNVITGYAPRTGCTQDKKDAFIEDMHGGTGQGVADHGRFVIGADMNGQRRNNFWECSTLVFMGWCRFSVFFMSVCDCSVFDYRTLNIAITVSGLFAALATIHISPVRLICYAPKSTACSLAHPHRPHVSITHFGRGRLLN